MTILIVLLCSSFSCSVLLQIVAACDAAIRLSPRPLHASIHTLHVPLRQLSHSRLKPPVVPAYCMICWVLLDRWSG